jgi:hypothetical protein
MPRFKVSAGLRFSFAFSRSCSVTLSPPSGLTRVRQYYMTLATFSAGSFAPATASSAALFTSSFTFM